MMLSRDICNGLVSSFKEAFGDKLCGLFVLDEPLGITITILIDQLSASRIDSIVVAGRRGYIFVESSATLAQEFENPSRDRLIRAVANGEVIHNSTSSVIRNVQTRARKICGGSRPLPPPHQVRRSLAALAMLAQEIESDDESPLSLALRGAFVTQLAKIYAVREGQWTSSFRDSFEFMRQHNPELFQACEQMLKDWPCDTRATSNRITSPAARDAGSSTQRGAIDKRLKGALAAYARGSAVS